MFTYTSTPFVVDEKKNIICESFTVDVYQSFDNFTVSGKTQTERRKGDRDSVKHFVLPCALDIETTKYFDKDEEGKLVEKRAMFVWQYSHGNQFCVMGRTVQELKQLFDKIMYEECTYHIFVHNLSYEATFLIQVLDSMYGSEVKLLNSRKFWQIKLGDNIVLHDSAVIANSSLAYCTTQNNHTYFKAVGDFNYDELFNIEKSLTHKQIGYCLLDVLSLVEYIQTLMENRNYTVFDLPKTQTGFVRKYILQYINKSGKNRDYRDFFRGTRLNAEQYMRCKKAFEGGWTGGSVMYYDTPVYGDIRCRDITSSYPYQMVARYYPISAFKEVTWHNMDEFTYDIENRCVIAYYTFENVRSRTPDSPRFSLSKFDIHENYEAFNGKVLSADKLGRYMTEVAFEDFRKYYTFDKMTVTDGMVAERGAIPKLLRDCILKFFNDKSSLKNVEGQETAYAIAKEYLNAIYGCSATALDRFEFELDIESMECEKKPCTDIQATLDKYYKNRNSFMPYQFACYVTSWARHQLFDMMDICGDGWLYSDTDSVYYISTPEIEKAFDDYNQTLNRCFFAYTSKGDKTTLGEVTPDGCYTEFKHLGAKKYVKKHDNDYIITVAGVPKKAGSKLISNLNEFYIGKNFKGKETGKLIPQYVFEPVHVAIVNGVQTLVASYQNLKYTDYLLSGVGNYDDNLDELFDTLNDYDYFYERGSYESIFL